MIQHKKDIPSSPLHNAMRANFDKLKVVRGVLYNGVTKDNTIKQQVESPESQISTVLHSLHNNMGH